MLGTVITNPVGLSEWLPPNLVPIAFDTETNGLQYMGMEMYGCSLCDGDRACYVDFLAMDGHDRRVAVDILRDYLKDVPLLIMHNAPFDLKVLYAEDIVVDVPVFCTMTAAHLIDENRSKSLKRLAITDLNVSEDVVVSWEESSTGGFSSPEFYQYAMNDAIWTWGLYQLYRPIIAKQGLYYLFWDVEMPFQYVLMDLAVNGILIDREELDRLTVEVSNKTFTLEKQMLEMIGASYSLEMYLDGRPPTILSGTNIGSDQQIAEILQNKFGIILTEETPSSTKENRRYSVSTGVLERLSDHEFVGLLLEYRKYEHLLSSFLLPLPDKIESDGRVRPSFNNCVTVTGRLSSSEPNFQNLPREETVDANFRGVLLASEGCMFVGADYASQELRVLAELSRDPTLIAAFNDGLNLHLSTAKAQFSLDIPDEALVESHSEFGAYKSKYKAEYNNAKIINYGIAYGKGAFGFSKDWDVPVYEAQKTVDDYFEAFPGVKDAIDRTHKFVRQNGFCANLSGRRRRFKTVNRRAYRQSFNFLVQGFSADMIKIAMVRLRSFLREGMYEAKIVLTVHDEIVVECPVKETEEVKELLYDAMIGASSLCVPLETTVKAGQRYSEVK